MKKIGFIGAYDKTDLILYVGKILTVLGKKVLIVDSTLNQKARYIVPVINPTLKYVTEFEEMDIAVGFRDFQDMKNYLGLADNQTLDYDIVLIDTDDIEGFNAYELEESNKNYFVTSFDNYSLKKGLEVLSGLKNPISLTKVIFSKEILKEEDDYLNFLSLGYKVIWNEYRLYFPIENGDLSVIYENQRLAKIKFKKLSVQYKDGLTYLAVEILENVSESNVRKVIKNIERGL